MFVSSTPQQLLSPHFEKVFGLDRSFEQLKHTSSESSNIQFIAGSAFDVPMKPRSIDLITVAQGLHWLTPFNSFFSEVDRLLKPGGTFAAVGYSIPILEHEPAQKVFQKYYFDVLGSSLKQGQQGCFWDIDRSLVDSQYSAIDFIYPSTLQRKDFPERVNMPLYAFINYLRTMSGYRGLLSHGFPDPLPQLIIDLQACFGNTDLNQIIVVVIPYYVTSCQKSGVNLVNS